MILKSKQRQDRQSKAIHRSLASAEPGGASYPRVGHLQRTCGLCPPGAATYCCAYTGNAAGAKDSE